MTSLRSTLTPILLALPPATAQVNAPVAPDAIYVLRSGPETSLSVVDLNGFGQSTGDPATSNFPNNPNVLLQGTLLTPPLSSGSTTLDGGSAGVFTLTRDAGLDDRLVGRPTLVRPVDAMLGQPLDLVFNNGLDPGGCQAGGGNLCAISGLQFLAVAPATPTSVRPGFPGDLLVNAVPSGGNPISWAPHPNPPGLTVPPLCVDPPIGGREPTSIDSLLGVGGSLPVVNLLGPGDPFGNPDLGIPPSGLLAPEQNTHFVGPSPSGLPLATCQSYMQRQQVGHFLYVADAGTGEIVVLSSNRMTVIDRIAVPHPTELAMSPDLDFLAVSSHADDLVTFVDIDPLSGTFHQVVQTTAVGDGPRGIAWSPDDEDVLVANEGSGTVSILSSLTFAVRKTLTRGLDRPFAIATTPRQSVFGGERNLGYAWILDRSGHVLLYESGPSGGPNGWGFDDIVARTSFTLARPKALQTDPLELRSGVWIAHERAVDATGSPTGLGGGALTELHLEFTTLGVLPIAPGETPSLREATIVVGASLGSDVLSGVPTDLAFDDLVNLGALPNPPALFGARGSAALNGKNPVRLYGAPATATNQASYLFAPVRTADGPQAIDVVELATGQRVDVDPSQPGVQSIPAAGAFGVMDYFRQ